MVGVWEGIAAEADFQVCMNPCTTRVIPNVNGKLKPVLP